MDKNRTSSVTQERPSHLARPDETGVAHPFSYGLKPAVLSSIDTLAQSVSCLAPTATPAILIPLVFGSAGNGTWLAYVIATVGLLLVGININHFASRSASPGSIYSYVGIGLGPGMGMLTGWLLLVAYIVVLSCLGGEFSFYAKPVLEKTLNLSVDPFWLIVGSSALAGYIAWRDIKISSSVMLVLEACSISLMLVLVAVTFAHCGSMWDWKQITLTNVSPQAVTMGLVFAIFGYTGFESAASLGSEAKDPLKSIPKAITRSCLWSGIFYVICAYAMIMGYRGSAVSLDKCDTPFMTLATLDGVPPLGLILSCGAVVSFFACILACINTASRLMFLMGHHGLFHESLSAAHADNRTPHVAVIISTVLGVLPALLLVSMHVSLIDIIAWTGTIASYAFIMSYALVSIASPVYLRQLRQLKPLHVLTAVLSVAAMSLALVGNTIQSGEGIARYLPTIFFGLVLVGLLWYSFLRMFAPETIQSMNEDMNAIRDRF